MRRSVAALLLLVLPWMAVGVTLESGGCDEEGADCCGPVCFSCLCCTGWSTAVVGPVRAPGALVLFARVVPEPFLPQLDVLPRQILHVPRALPSASNQLA